MLIVWNSLDSFIFTFQDSISEAASFFEAGQTSGWLKPVVGTEYEMNEACAAQRDVIEHKTGSQGKIVLNIDHQ